MAVLGGGPASMAYDVERYGHLDKGLLVEVGIVYVDADGEPVMADGWCLAYAKYAWHRDVGGPERVCGYTLHDLRDIARTHRKLRPATAEMIARHRAAPTVADWGGWDSVMPGLTFDLGAYS